MATPNMVLVLPVVESTIGPTWATNLNTALELVDAHDHSSGKGVKVPAAGLNINADVSMQSNNLNGIRALRLNSQSAELTGADDVRIIYSKNGELAYRDANGDEVILTSGGSIAGTSGSISGLSSPASAVFSSITGALTVSKDTNKPAKLRISEIAIYEFDNASANPITLKSPASLGSSYSLTLPDALPATTAVTFISSAGVMSTLERGNADEVLQVNSAGTGYEYGKVATANIVDNAVTLPKMLDRSIVEYPVSGAAPVGRIARSASFTGTVTQTSPTSDANLLEIDLVAGRPVLLMVVPDENSLQVSQIKSATSGAYLSFAVDGSIIGTVEVGFDSSGSGGGATGPLMQIWTPPTTDTYTFDIRYWKNVATGTFTVLRMQLIAIQL